MEKKYKFKLEFLLYRITEVFIKILPEFTLPLFYWSLGTLFYIFGKRYTKIINKNLTIAFPEKDEKEKKKLIKESFFYLAKLIVDLTKYNSIKKIEKVMEKGDISSLKNAAAEGKGAILISGHFGNWELGLLWIGKNVEKISAIVRKMDNPYVEKKLRAFREQTGNTIIYKDMRAAAKSLKVLKEKKFLGIMVDVSQQEKEGIYANFFTKLASTTPTPAKFHLKTGAPIIPVFTIPKGRKYQIYSLPPIEVELTGNKEKDTLLITERINKTLENEIRKYPQYYFWFHKRWKHQPGNRIDEY